jgi:hypothetical protein
VPRRRPRQCLAPARRREQPHPARLRRSDQVVAGSSRSAHSWRMPFRSLQRLPPRSPLRSLDRSAPRWARGLAGRAGSRHRHPLPNMQNNKTGHTAKTGAVCRVPEDTMTENQSGCLVLPHTTLGGVRGAPERRQAGHPDSCWVVHTPAARFPPPARTVTGWPKQVASAVPAGIDGDLGCVEAKSAQSSARISRCAPVHAPRRRCGCSAVASSPPQAWA